MNDFEKLKDMMIALMAMEISITRKSIKESVDKHSAPFGSSISAKQKEELVRYLESQFDVNMRVGAIIQEEFEPWLEASKASINPYYWDRYKRLLQKKGFGLKVIPKLDQNTDKTLGLLEKPDKPGSWERKGMVVGHVQSGKTANYIGLICKAADAGYKLIIVIAGIQNNLRSQTQERIDEGFVGKDSSRLLNTDQNNEKFIGVGQYGHKTIPITLTNTSGDFNKKTAEILGMGLNTVNIPVILVIKKNYRTLENLIAWLKEHNAVNENRIENHPMLMIDDEADNASINTSVNPQETTRINGLIRQTLNLFHKRCYVGYTATPFANIFIDPDSDEEMLGGDLFPRDFIVSLDAPDNNEDFIESEFVEYVSEFLVDSGEIESFDYCQYKADRGIRVDGYNFMDDEGVLNLIISDFRNEEEITSLTMTDIEATFKCVENFFLKSLKPEFYPQLEETSPGYGLAYDIFSRKSSFSKVKLFLFSNGVLSSRIQALENKKTNGYLISYNVWDATRLHRIFSSKNAKEDIVIDFVESFGEPLHCLPAHIETDAYQSFFLVMPGNMLASLYDEYGARLLEQNVRCFLQFRGNVNKELRNTIDNDPEMFFAYNNGITATAEEIDVEHTNGVLKIKLLKNLQIVNGGQTTASIFTANKKDSADLTKIFVQMKLSIVDPERAVHIVPKISEYANTQNKVNAADFFANHPFHVRMEEFSRRLWAPPKDGELRQTKWFYERARGQYLDAQANLTTAEKKKVKIEYPKPQMFTKTDLAKFENAWENCPQMVSKGAQKNFVFYASEVGKKWGKDENLFNELYFKHTVAKAIVFRTTEKLIMTQDWYGGGYRANIVVYSIAWIAEKVSSLNMTVDLSKIWEKQAISDAFFSTLESVTFQIHGVIIDTPTNISNVTEWCKKDGCWDRVKDFDMDLADEFVDELVGIDLAKEDKKKAKNVQKIDDGIEAQRKVLELGPDKWKKISLWGVDMKLLSEKDMGILSAAVKIPNKIPTEKQSLYLVKLIDRLETEGFQL